MVFEDRLDASLLDKDREERERKEKEREEMRKLYAESFKDIKKGKVVEGTVIDVRNDHVLIDIGYKSEGTVPIEEFVDKRDVKVGDRVRVLLESIEDKEGVVVLSKVKADKLSHWEETVALFKEGKIVPGKVVRKVRGGLMVDIGLEAFLPASHIDLKHVKNPASYIGREMEFKVIKINQERKNVVLSRRIILEAEREKLRKKLLSTITTGAVLDGVVKNITDFGAFIDLKGIDGLLHITDMSWGRISHPRELLSVGDKIKVKVLEFDTSRERISLGLKQLTSNPWDTVEEKYPVSSRVKGRVVNIVQYGAFIELEKGIEGLVHVSELSWTRKINHPSEVLGIGDVVEAVVLSIDKDARKISLGLKQTETNPWMKVESKYPIGTIIKGRIRNIAPYGAFVELEEGIDGLIHISDMSWTRKLNHPSEVVKRGEVVEAKVLSTDQENKKIALGIKQLTPNPWDEIDRKYRVGDTVTGEISNVTGFGLFVKLEDGIEGLVHISQTDKGPDEDLKARYDIGDAVKAKILRIDPVDRKIGLSIKEHLEDLEQGVIDAEEEAEYREKKPEMALDNPVLSEDIKIAGLSEDELEQDTS
jgi:small subunit ribosomal protein S1